MPPQDARRPTTRRTVVRGAAWTAPALLTAAAVPAYAASPCIGGNCPNIAFGTVASANASTAGNGWSYTLANGTMWQSNTNPSGFQPSSSSAPWTTTMGSYFSASREPRVNSNRQMLLTQTGQPALKAGCAYTIRVGLITWTNPNSTPLSLRVLVGTTIVGTYTTPDDDLGNTNRGFVDFPVPASTAGVLSFRIDYSGTGDHDDIHLYQPSVICA